VMRLAKAIEEYAPRALLLTFTNPASVVQYALTRTSNLKVIGLCDAPVTMVGWAAQALACSPSELSVDYVGMHHYGFITKVVRDGLDVTEDVVTGLSKVHGIDVDPDIIQSLGVVPSTYLKYFLHPDRILNKQIKQKQSRAEQLQQIEVELIAQFRKNQSSALGKRSAKWYDAIIAPVLMALIRQVQSTFIVNVTNGSTHSWLPTDAIIESPCMFDHGQIRPLALPMPKREIAGRIQHNCAYEQLMVEAILEQSESKALQALLLNELVPNVDTARAILKRIFPDADPTRGN